MMAQGKTMPMRLLVSTLSAMTAAMPQQEIRVGLPDCQPSRKK